jgi:hypothetical protein
MFKLYIGNTPTPGNYITHKAGRSPAFSGTTLLHAANNVWQDNNGHALEGYSRSRILLSLPIVLGRVLRVRGLLLRLKRRCLVVLVSASSEELMVFSFRL